MGSTYLGWGYIRATSQCTARIRGVEANFEQLKYRVASAISRDNHNRSCGTCNMPLTTHRDKAQCNVKRHAEWQLTPSSCWMKVECRGAIANARAPKASKNFDHLFRGCGSTPSRSAIKSTTANSSWFAQTMCGRSHIGSNLRQRYSRVGAIKNKRSTQCRLLILYTCATISTYYGLRFRPRPLFWFWACKCCMYVRLEAQLSIPDARKFQDRDESRWVVQKWEEEVAVGKILHPTQSHAKTTPSSPCALSPPSPHPSTNASPTSPPLAMEELHVESILHPTSSMNVDGSSTFVAKASGTPLDPVPPSSILSGIVVAAPSGDHPTSPSGCPSAEQILVDVCKALSDSQGSFRPSMSEVEALLGNDWRQPLHVTVPSLSPQEFECEAHHFGDLTTESYVKDCVVYHWWAARTALSADWDTMGLVWVVHDSLWNASCASAQRRKQPVKSWAERTLQASSIGMSFAPFDFHIWIPSIYVDVRWARLGGRGILGANTVEKNRNGSKGANTWEES